MSHRVTAPSSVARREAGAVAGELQRRQVGLALEPAPFGQRGGVEEHDVAAVGDGDNGTVRADLATDVSDGDRADERARLHVSHHDRRAAGARRCTGVRHRG